MPLWGSSFVGVFPFRCRHLEAPPLLHEVHTAPLHLQPMADRGSKSAFGGHTHTIPKRVDTHQKPTAIRSLASATRSLSGLSGSVLYSHQRLCRSRVSLTQSSTRLSDLVVHSRQRLGPLIVPSTFALTSVSSQRQPINSSWDQTAWSLRPGDGAISSKGRFFECPRGSRQVEFHDPRG